MKNRHQKSLINRTFVMAFFCISFMLLNSSISGLSQRSMNISVAYSPESKPDKIVLSNNKLQTQIEHVHAEIFAQEDVDVSYYYHPIKEYTVGYKLVYSTDNRSTEYTIFYNLKHELQFTAYAMFEQDTATLIYFNSFDRVHGTILKTDEVGFQYFDSNNNLVSEELFSQLFTKLLP